MNSDRPHIRGAGRAWTFCGPSCRPTVRAAWRGEERTNREGTVRETMELRIRNFMGWPTRRPFRQRQRLTPEPLHGPPGPGGDNAAGARLTSFEVAMETQRAMGLVEATRRLAHSKQGRSPPILTAGSWLSPSR